MNSPVYLLVARALRTSSHRDGIWRRVLLHCAAPGLQPHVHAVSLRNDKPQSDLNSLINQAAPTGHMGLHEDVLSLAKRTIVDCREPKMKNVGQLTPDRACRGSPGTLQRGTPGRQAGESATQNPLLSLTPAWR